VDQPRANHTHLLRAGSCPSEEQDRERETKRAVLSPIPRGEHRAVRQRVSYTFGTEPSHHLR
jgi:hypothetical protein